MSGLSRSPLRDWARQRLLRWLARRQPAVASLTLRHRFLLVLPSRYGLAFSGLILLLYILGTNYQNNLVLLLSFMLLSLLLLCIVLSYRNLAGLTLLAGPPVATFAGQQLQLIVSLQHWQHRQSLQFELGNWQCQQQQGWLQLQHLPTQRGLYQLPRLKLSSVHPFGLVRCWCYLALQQQYWVYPTPLPHSQTPAPLSSNPDQSWSHLQPYAQGDKLQRIDWKKLARQPTQPVVKVYQSEQAPPPQLCLVLPPLEGAALELKLQQLTRQILDLSAAGQSYSLQLPDALIKYGSGPEQQQRCLQALALC